MTTEGVDAAEWLEESWVVLDAGDGADIVGDLLAAVPDAPHGVTLRPDGTLVADETERLLTALARYGSHDPTCAVVGRYDYPCNCGFQAALSSGGES